MSRNKVKIDGVRCAMILRGAVNGEYSLLFERRLVTLEQIEAINWAKPELTGDYDPLPAGYGFEATGITYSSSDQTYRVHLRVLRQYLGDVTGYQAQVTELEGLVSELKGVVAEQRGTIETKEDVIRTQEGTIQTQQDTITAQQQTIDQQAEEIQSQQSDILEKDHTIQTQQTAIIGYTASVAGLTAVMDTVAVISTELPDALVLDMAELAPGCFSTWADVLQNGTELAQGRVIEKDGQLYRVVQPVTPRAHQEPSGEGMLAIYRPIDWEHAGTLEDPVP